MLFNYNATFAQMDELSLSRVPFFFMVSFDTNKIIILEKKEIKKRGLLYDLQIDKFHYNNHVSKPIEWNSFPETKTSYQEGFKIVQNHLRKGNTYLVNYTCKTPIETNCTLEELFYLSKAKYKVYLPDKMVFFSPETFVKIRNQKIYTYPMKGTIDASIKEAKSKLKNSLKEKAEHYTVVDLLRNDLSQIADNVQVNEFQRTELIKTKQKNLLAMSSKISGKLKVKYQYKIGSIMEALLPAGSILGAPKAKTLAIIKEAEKHERNFYTGICGYFDGENLDSCVMIRMVEKENENLFFRSGGGITHKSNMDEEYEEMINKIYVPIY